jgi:hypothetical protein
MRPLALRGVGGGLSRQAQVSGWPFLDAAVMKGSRHVHSRLFSSCLCYRNPVIGIPNVVIIHQLASV